MGALSPNGDNEMKPVFGRIDIPAFETLRSNFKPRIAKLAYLHNISREDANDCALDAYIKCAELSKDPSAFTAYWLKTLEFYVADKRKDQEMFVMPEESETLDFLVDQHAIEAAEDEVEENRDFRDSDFEIQEIAKQLSPKYAKQLLKVWSASKNLRYENEVTELPQETFRRYMRSAECGKLQAAIRQLERI